MGKRFTVFDDLDDKLDAARTVTFSLDSAAYEIDLSEQNIEKLTAALEPFVQAGRRAGRAVPVKSAGTKKAANPELDAIRQWASKHGHRVSDKGRIPRDVVDAYEAANAAPAAPAAPAKAAKAPTKAPAAKVAEPAFSAASK